MNEIIINGEVFVKKEPASDWYIIRTYSAGVHFGNIVRREGKEVELTNARRIWSWAGAASLSQLAVDGVAKPDECRFSVRVNSIILTEAIEVIQCSEKAAKNINEVPEWKS